MTKYEKTTFFRFIGIYLTISFLLFITLSSLYYADQKQLIEDKLNLQMNLLSKQYNNKNIKLPKDFNFTIESSDLYQYPAFIKNQETYIYTSCGSLNSPDKILVIKTNRSTIEKKLNELKKKIIYNMFFLFIINFIISIILASLALKPVREASEEFKIFVDDIIHDLNAPISSISINTDSLLESYSEKKLHRITRSIDSIKNIYSNLESILQFEYKNTPEIINLNEICEDILFKFKPIFHNAKFTIEIQKDINLKINQFIFERIIVNVIENAVKYSKNNPHIILGMDKKHRFYIKDNGPGMKNPYYLLKRTVQSNKTNKGYGLGLSIVRRLSEISNINLEIDSKKNEGTTFYFDLSHHISNIG